jgi:hypothetical protein
MGFLTPMCTNGPEKRGNKGIVSDSATGVTDASWTAVPRERKCRARGSKRDAREVKTKTKTKGGDTLDSPTAFPRRVRKAYIHGSPYEAPASARAKTGKEKMRALSQRRMY